MTAQQTMAPQRDLHHVIAPASLVTWFEHFSTADPARVHVADEGDHDAAALADRLLATGGRRFMLHSSHRSLHRDAAVAARLRVAGADVVCHAAETMDLALDKPLMKRLFADLGVRTPPGPREASPAVRDWVIKRRLGTEGQGMRFATGAALAPEAEEYVEAFISGLEYSVVAYVSDGRFVSLPVVEKGWSTPELRPPYRRARVCPPAAESAAVVEQMIAISSQIAVGGRMSGWLEVEFVVDCHGRPWVLEINPRVCGTMRLAAMCIDVPLFDIPERPEVDGPLAAVRTGAEVPWHGSPMADPAGRIFATSRLTVAADDRAALAERLAALGINLEEYGQTLSARGYRDRLRAALAEAGTEPLPATDAVAVLFGRLVLPGEEAPRQDRVFLSDALREHLAWARGVAPWAAETASGDGPETVRRAIQAAAMALDRGDHAHVYAVLDTDECDTADVMAAVLAHGDGPANLTLVLSGHASVADHWRAGGWEVCRVAADDLAALEAALRGLPGSRPRVILAEPRPTLEASLDGAQAGGRTRRAR